MGQMFDSNDYALTLLVERDVDRPCGRDDCSGYHVLTETPDDHTKLVSNQVVLAALLQHAEEILAPAGMTAVIVRNEPNCGHHQPPSLGEGSPFGTPSPRPPSDGGTLPPWQR